MLYLKSPAQGAEGRPRQVSICEQTALRLERALLASDPIARHAEVAQALADDRDLAGWTLRAAELRLGQTVNRVEEATDWLTGCLESELAAALDCNELSQSSASDVEWRLPALVRKLSDYERRLSDFHGRLEHEKLESLKELAYGASHEINNPLANIAARAQTLLADEADPERGRKLTAIHRQAMRAHEMIADLMLFARPPKLNLAPCELSQLTQEVVGELVDLAQENDVELSCEPANQGIEASVDKTQLGVAIRALIINSLEAAGEGGHVNVAVRQTTSGNEQWAEIAVRDDGPGISEEVRRHMFDPFFSGREAGRGLGFGLSKCWRIVTDHGGQVIAKQPTGGAEIAIQLPLAARAGSQP